MKEIFDEPIPEDLPETIRRYVKLFFVSYTIGICINLFDLAPPEYYRQSLAQMIFVGVATFLTMATVVGMIVLGKNWARLFMLISGVIGSPFFVIGTHKYFQVSAVGGIGFLAVNATQYYCLYLLFCKSSSLHFKRKSGQNERMEAPEA